MMIDNVIDKKTKKQIFDIGSSVLFIVLLLINPLIAIIYLIFGVGILAYIKKRQGFNFRLREGKGKVVK